MGIGNGSSIYNSSGLYNGATGIYNGSGVYKDGASAESGIKIGDKYYTSVVIGTQEWLVENLDFVWDGLTVPTSGGTSTNQQAMYINYDEATYGWNGYKCGLLYNWYALNYLQAHRAELIPGWRVPNTDDLNTLKTFLGDNAGYKLAATNATVSAWAPYWKGWDTYGFKALPTGSFNNGAFSMVGQRSRFGTTTTRYSSYYYQANIEASSSSSFSWGYNEYVSQTPIRLLKE